MNQRWYLAIDLGTGGTKVGAVREDGRILAAAFSSVDTDLTDDGGCEQDTEQWWTGTVGSIRDVLAALNEPGECAGIGITGQWLRRAGGAPNPNGADPTGHAQFLKHERPDAYRRAAALIEPVDFVGLRPTGRIAATPASMLASWPTANRPGAEVGYDATLVKLARRDRAKLPDLIATGSVLGTLLPDVAAELRLPVSTPVVCGVPDLHTAAIGAGAVAEFAGHISISTTAWVSAQVPLKKADVIHQMASIPGLRESSYLIANNHETGGSALRWLRDAVLTDGGYDALTAEAATAVPGSGGVIFCPWLNGERSPVSDENLRASFLNVSIATTRADLIRAVLEGVAYNARWLLEATENFAGRPLDGLRLLGGGATSDLWCQIYADVIGRPIHQVADPVNVNPVSYPHLTLPTNRE